MRVLVLNAGSSSLKFDVIDHDSAATVGSAGRVVGGAVDRVGTESRLSADLGDQHVERGVAAGNHAEATVVALRFLTACGVGLETIDAVGHRVVHGGRDLTTTTVLSPDVLDAIAAAGALAPLHNARALDVIAAAERLLGPAVPGVAVFDTTFHAGMPPEAALYAIPTDIATRHGIRRYGFHGIAHQYMAQRWGVLSGRSLEGTRLVTLQLGQGASVAAVAGGRSIDTSMGFTPLEGLIMGTRSGDVDPTVVTHIARMENVTADEVTGWLNTRSGLLGLSGTSGDMAELLGSAARGDHAADAAVSAFGYRARKYVGAYLAVLDGADAVIFGGGIGENEPTVRASICAGLAWCGLTIDDEKNMGARGLEANISAPDSAIAAWVIPVDEASAVAAETAHVLSSRSGKATDG